MIRFFGCRAKIRDCGVIITKLGLAMFDFYGRRHRVMPRHSLALRGRTREAFPVLPAVRFAQATAALNATGLGSQAGIEDYDNTLAFMRTTPTRVSRYVAA